ncbi:MAG TPA: BACON domain-containing carbohydrate-binding protein [Vicinamibacterales bacterium]|nr:BACON domain-containing carbohydrate-binding protein [Vicinamibacterales bacterium]
MLRTRQRRTEIAVKTGQHSPTRPLTLLAVALACAFAVLGCNSTSTNVATGPTPVKCTVALTLAQATMDPAGGPGAVTVTSAPECAWTATSEVSWITNLSPASGQGTADIHFQVAPNPSQAGRQGAINVNGVRANVGQGAPACSITIAPTSQAVPAGGGSGQVHVSAATGCGWAVTSNDSWLTIASGSSGDGNGVVGFTAAANTGAAARVGTLTIANQTFTVAQPEPGAPPCSNAIQPTSQNVGSGATNITVTITATPSCSWTAVSNVAWLAVFGIGTGVGNGSVTIAAAANTGNTRVGTATIAGQTLTVTQTGSCLATFAPPSASLTAAAGNSSTAVTIAAGCAWTASTADSWITITSGASGTGNGTVAFSVAANSGSARSGTITIANQPFSVTQAGSCVATLNPTSQTVGSGAGSATVGVAVPAGCAWTASTTTPWITITSGASGSGNGTVAFDVTANPNTTSRTGPISIAGQTHTVTQSGACPASLNPASQTVSAGGGAATDVDVTTPTGCAWTATETASWITITSGASGTGNGTVRFTVAANTGPQRVDTITIAGQPHTVTQSSGCTFSINPTSQNLSKNAQTGTTITVTAGAGCPWTAVSNDSFITVETGASGTGNGTVTFSVSNNNTGNARTGTITIAGKTFTVNQGK